MEIVWKMKEQTRVRLRQIIKRASVDTVEVDKIRNFLNGEKLRVWLNLLLLISEKIVVYFFYHFFRLQIVIIS